jgi:hypothetical protein
LTGQQLKALRGLIFINWSPQDLQRRISCLSVAENSAQMAMKRDRLAFELRMIEGGIQARS